MSHDDIIRAYRYAAVMWHPATAAPRGTVLQRLSALNKLLKKDPPNLPSDNAVAQLFRVLLERPTGFVFPGNVTEAECATLTSTLQQMGDHAVFRLHTCLSLVLDNTAAGNFHPVGAHNSAHGGTNGWANLRHYLEGLGSVNSAEEAHLLIRHLGGVAPGQTPTQAQLLQAAQKLAELGNPGDAAAHDTHVGRLLAAVKAVRAMDGSLRAVGDGRGAGMWYQLRQQIRAQAGFPADATDAAVDRLIYYLAEETPTGDGIPDEATLVAAAYRLADMTPAEIVTAHRQLHASEVTTRTSAGTGAAPDSGWTCSSLFLAGPPSEIDWLTAEVAKVAGDQQKFTVLFTAVDERLRCRAGVLDAKTRQHIQLGLQERLCEQDSYALVKDWQTVLVDCNELTLTGMRAKGGKHTHIARAPVAEWCYIGQQRNALTTTEASTRVLAILDRFHGEIAGLATVVVSADAAGGTDLTLHNKLREMEAELNALKETHAACAVYVDAVLTSCHQGDDAVFNPQEQPVYRSDKWIRATLRRTHALNGLTAVMAQDRIDAYSSTVQNLLGREQDKAATKSRYREPDAALGYAYDAFTVTTMEKVVAQAHPSLAPLSAASTGCLPDTRKRLARIFTKPRGNFIWCVDLGPNGYSLYS